MLQETLICAALDIVALIKFDDLPKIVRENLLLLKVKYPEMTEDDVYTFVNTISEQVAKKLGDSQNLCEFGYLLDTLLMNHAPIFDEVE